MKTQIIQLEPHDDVISTRDKMGWSQTSRILLVWPEKGKILVRRLDLIMLRRHSSSLGSQLALVTSDAEVKFNASYLGIPVYPSPRQAQAVHWRIPFYHRPGLLRRSTRPVDLAALKEKAEPKQSPWMNNRIVYWAAFAISLVAVLALAMVILPGAAIHLTPKTQVQELDLPVSASAKYTIINLAGSLPAHQTLIVVEGRGVITATGTIDVPVSQATGSVQFKNLTDDGIIIPAGTRLSTLGSNPIWFITTREGKVAAGIGKTVLVPVQAVQPGKSGNQPAGKIQAVSGPQGFNLSVINPGPLRGGTDAPAPAPTQEDENRLYNQLLNSLRKTALQELNDRYTGTPLESGFPIISSFQFSKILEKNLSPAVKSPGEMLQLSLRLEFKALEISAQDLQQLVTPLLDASLPEGYTILPDTLSVSALTEPVLDDQEIAHWVLLAQRQLQAVIAPEEAVQIARGLPVAKARQALLIRLPLAKSPDIQTFPSWWIYTPFLPLRIQVEGMQ
jgi:hypothetical protein